MPSTVETAALAEAIGTSSGKAEPKYWKLAEYLRQQVGSGAMKPGDRLPSFAEIQTQFGVSLGTVQKVHTMLEQEGLIVREQGRGTFVAEPPPSSGLIGLIGNLFKSSFRDAHYSMRLLGGVGEVLEREEKQVVMLDANSSLGWERVEGVLISISELDELLPRLPANLPRVTLMLTGEQTSAVIADDFDGARQAVHELVALGHRRIGCLMEKEPLIARKRTDGYLAGLKEAGIEPQAQWLYRTTQFYQDYREGGKQHVKEWLKTGWKETGCTALIAQNDLAAVGAMEAFQEAGLSVPADVSVLGFDSTEICDIVSPRLSAMEVPLHQIGAESMELLLRQIREPKRLPQTVVFPMRFKQRESVRAL